MEETKSCFDIDQKASEYNMYPDYYKFMLMRSCCVPEVPEHPDDSPEEEDK